MMTSRTKTVIAASIFLLAACGSDNRDLEQWVAEAQARPAAAIEPIPEIAAYKPYTYRPRERRAPFTATVARRDEKRPKNNGVTPDTDRPRESLEAFELDSLRMVGTISHGGTTYALVLAPDNVIHRVRPGDHVGRNYGEIVNVADDGLTLTEIIPDSSGQYVKRPAAIAPSR